MARGRKLATRARVGVCSNFSHTPTAERVLDAAGLRPHLTSVVVSESVGIRKPRPEIFEAALRELGVAPEETLHVGDNLDADVAGASALGMRTAWLTRRVRDAEAKLAAHEGPKPDHVIGRLDEIGGLL